MRKLITILICATLLFCVACSESKEFTSDTTCEQILNAATAVESYDNTKNYIKGKTDFNANTMSMWSDGVFDECQEFNLLDDYAICYSNDNTTYEISVLKAKSKDDVSKLESLFERRKKTLEGGTQAAYDPNFKKIMQDAKIITDGDFVMLLLTNDNDAVIKAIEKLK